jgi:hypothetical protein
LFAGVKKKLEFSLFLNTLYKALQPARYARPSGRQAIREKHTLKKGDFFPVTHGETPWGGLMGVIQA